MRQMFFLDKINIMSLTNTKKIYIYSPGLYQKLIKCFSIHIPIHIIPNILSENDIDIVIEEVINKKDFDKSNTDIENFDSKEKIKFPQEYENNSIIILDDINEKEINNDKIQAMFERGCHNNLSIFIINQDYYELPRKTIRAKGNIYHIFKPNNFSDVRNIYQNKTSMDMPLD